MFTKSERQVGSIITYQEKFDAGSCSSEDLRSEEDDVISKFNVSVKVFDKSTSGNRLVGQGKMNMASAISALVTSESPPCSTLLDIALFEANKPSGPSTSSTSSPLIATASKGNHNQLALMSKASSSSSLEVLEGNKIVGTITFQLHVTDK